MAAAQTWGSSSTTTAGRGSTSSILETSSLFDEALARIAPTIGLERIQNTGKITELVLGNGLVTTEYLADFLVQAQTEVLLSTCFWAASSSLAVIYDALIALNERARQNDQRIVVRIMFSSYSFRQKFMSLKGTRIWKPNTWRKLGLPDPQKLDWLDMTVFSRFRKPFGVMHAKFLVIDRTTVLLPSSNISCMLYHG
jgi:phosphatidylserine/phosphatidylglycerophosphate/cardiolipin synthase-like enzyme